MNMLQSGSSSLILLAGLAIGVVHAFEPDHLAAVTTQIMKKEGIGGSYHSDNEKRG